MSRWRKKPVVIEAFEFLRDPIPDWFMDQVSLNQIILHGCGQGDTGTCSIKTPEGIMTGRIGDWIIKGVKGEIYPCKADIFAETYEREGKE